MLARSTSKGRDNISRRSCSYASEQLVSSNAAVFNKTLPYSPDHKANINYEGARRGHDGGKRERKTVLTGTDNAPAPPCAFYLPTLFLSFFLCLFSLFLPLSSFYLFPSLFRVLPASWGTVTREWRVLPVTTRVAR